MIEKNKIHKFVEFFDKPLSVALICHINPDCDTLGSALALKRMFEKFGKTAEVFCDDMPSEKLNFIPDIKSLNKSQKKLFDLAVAVDCSDIGRLGKSNKYYQKAHAKITIDHHKTNNFFGDYTICDFTASSTAELVYHVIRYMEKSKNIEIMDDIIASQLFTAIVGDSGAFSFSNTSSETHLIASELKKFNFDSTDIIYRLMKKQPVNAFKLKARVLNNAKFYNDNKICIITFSHKDYEATDTNSEFTEGIIPEIINIDSVLIAMSVAEVYDKYYKISIRTKEPYDAAEIATIFGGGGHERAAGCRLNGFYEDIIEKLLKASNDLLM